MTQEEKALEIQHNDPYCVWNGGCPNVRRGAIQMAQWKDEQLSKYLENLEKEYIRNSGKGLLSNEEIAAKLATLKRIEEEMK